MNNSENQPEEVPMALPEGFVEDFLQAMRENPQGLFVSGKRIEIDEIARQEISIGVNPVKSEVDDQRVEPIQANFIEEARIEAEKIRNDYSKKNNVKSEKDEINYQSKTERNDSNYTPGLAYESSITAYESPYANYGDTKESFPENDSLSAGRKKTALPDSLNLSWSEILYLEELLREVIFIMGIDPVD
jgi:hypothetical protein